MLTIVYCRGNDKDAPTVAKRSGMRYGTRHDNKPYSTDIYMLDINWEKYIWSDYMSKVKRYAPTIAMVPDYMNSDQLPLLLERIQEVKKCGVEKVVVCPKFSGAVADIPNDCLVAVSVHTRYAGFLPDASEIIGRQVHLLGGRPDQQQYLIRHRYNKSNIVSVDGNTFAYRATTGQFWSLTKPGWKQTRGHRYTSELLELYSAINIVKYLNNPNSIIRMNKPVSKCMTDEERKRYGFRDIISSSTTE